LKYLSVCKWKNFESNKTLITILRSKIKVLLGLAIKYDYFRINADNLKNKKNSCYYRQHTSSGHKKDLDILQVKSKNKLVIFNKIR